MLLESKLLEENQVFISTGLGGKGSKLRYFVVLILKKSEKFSELQKKIVRNEFELMLKRNDAEIEELEFMETFATLLAILPLKVSLKDVFREAILEPAAGIILIHNHPSGNPEPSEEDRQITLRLSEATRLVGIPLLDHLIVGAERYVSMAERGLLAG